jgi:hypothetical protein
MDHFCCVINRLKQNLIVAESVEKFIEMPHRANAHGKLKVLCKIDTFFSNFNHFGMEFSPV